MLKVSDVKTMYELCSEIQRDSLLRVTINVIVTTYMSKYSKLSLEGFHAK